MGKKALTDCSLLITESLVRAGAEVFIGYPITPANLIYKYSTRKFPFFMAAPDEITTLQWMSGFAAAGRLPVTATSFPGFALMVESINMAYMMELPMLIILIQRLGPSTGTATAGAQGDLLLLQGLISGGMSIPVFSISGIKDAWTIPPMALEAAVNLRTPVILLTSKEEVMTSITLDIETLPPVHKIERKFYSAKEKYRPYAPVANEVPDFLPVGTSEHQVRFTASTHNSDGILMGLAPEALENSMRLDRKVKKNIHRYLFYEYTGKKHDKILVSWGISSLSCKEAVTLLKEENEGVDLLICKTLLPVPEVYFEILSDYKKVFVVEENLTGQFRQILTAGIDYKKLDGINSFGRMISPESIVKAVKND